MMASWMANSCIIIVLCLVIGGAIAYIVKEKKRGVKCIGCPMSGQCAHRATKGGKGCSCHSAAGQQDQKADY